MSKSSFAHRRLTNVTAQESADTSNFQTSAWIVRCSNRLLLSESAVLCPLTTHCAHIRCTLRYTIYSQINTQKCRESSVVGICVKLENVFIMNSQPFQWPWLKNGRKQDIRQFISVSGDTVQLQNTGTSRYGTTAEYRHCKIRYNCRIQALQDTVQLQNTGTSRPQV